MSKVPFCLYRPSPPLASFFPFMGSHSLSPLLLSLSLQLHIFLLIYFHSRGHHTAWPVSLRYKTSSSQAKGLGPEYANGSWAQNKHKPSSANGEAMVSLFYKPFQETKWHTTTKDQKPELRMGWFGGFQLLSRGKKAVGHRLRHLCGAGNGLFGRSALWPTITYLHLLLNIVAQQSVWLDALR